MAAFGAKGIQGGTIVNIENLFENRGVSYGAGGDDGAVTVPNFIKRYNPKLQGASVGEHLASICYGPLCPPFQCKCTTLIFYWSNLQILDALYTYRQTA